MDPNENNMGGVDPNVVRNNLMGPAVENQEAYAAAQIGFHAAFFDYLEKTDPDPAEALALEVPSKTALEQHIFPGDVPGFREWVSERDLGVIGLHKIQVANKRWQSGLKIQREQILDDQLGLVMPTVMGLGKKAKKHPGQLIAKLLLNGFAGTAFPDVSDGTCYDGSMMFSTTHSLEGGPQQSNLLDHVALTSLGLEQAYTLMNGFTTYDGVDPLDIEPTDLVVGPTLEWAAKRLVGSQLLIRNPGDTPGQSATGADSNIHLGTLRVRVSKRIRNYGAGLDFSKAWFLVANDEPVKPFLFQRREPITVVSQVSWESEDMFKKGQMNFGAQARYNVANYDWRLIVGSLGA